MEAKAILKNLYLDKCRFQSFHRVPMRMLEDISIPAEHLSNLLKSDVVKAMVSSVVEEKSECIERTDKETEVEYRAELFIFTRREMVNLVESIKEVISRHE